MRRLAVIPSDPLEFCRQKGLAERLNTYFNPGKVFDEVFLFSPLEKEERVVDGIRVFPVKDVDLARRVAEFKIDVVRAYGGNWPSDMACYFRVDGVPAVVSVHDRRLSMLRPSVVRADVVFCVSEEVRELVLRQHKDPSRVWLRPNGVDLHWMKRLSRDVCREVSERFPFPKRILHVGRKSPEKNIGTLIRALALLKEDWCLIAVGPGNDAELRILAEENGVGQRCFFVETVPNSELSKYYSMADCFCLPSTSEAMSNVILEAFACECPSVLSAVAAGGVGAKDGREAVLVADPLNAQGLALAIVKAASEEIAPSMTERAYALAKTFESSAMAKVEAGHYEKILRMKDEGLFQVETPLKASLYLENLGRRIVKKAYGS